MARIRSIHPGWHTDEAVMELTIECPLAAVLLTGIWCESDDDGVFDWKPLTLKARCLPAVNEDINALLAALEGKGIVRRFESGGRAYGAVRNFRKFQRPKKPNTRFLLPDELRTYVGLDAVSSETVPPEFPPDGEIPPQMEDGGGREGGEERKREARFDARPRSNGSDPPKQSPKRGTRLPEDWTPSEAEMAYAVERLGEDRAAREVEDFRDYWLPKAGKDATKLDWGRTWKRWVRRAPEFQGGNSARGSPASPADKAKERAMIERYLGNGDH